MIQASWYATVCEEIAYTWRDPQGRIFMIGLGAWSAIMFGLGVAVMALFT